MGMPVGGDMEYVDEVTMDKALSNRHEISESEAEPARKGEMQSGTAPPLGAR